jgi:eukaryotic-like serine/threonine-protein kinase
MAAVKPLTIQAGMLIAGRYRITREIGRGGMAQVYESEHLDIGKRVAIKILAAEFATSTVVVERFLREARAAAAVRSPYICDVFDSGKLDDQRPFLVMELLEGESLYERMVRVRQFDAATTLRITTHVGRGLTKAHAANIVHRDLKPENIFLTTNEDGELLAKILDFGLAKFYAPAAEAGEQARLTREGAIFGTPAYMSPEQVKGQGAVDHRADLWALGCIVYECLTGRTVWSTEQGVAMTFAQIASAPLPRIGRYRPDLPPALDDWFCHALERNITDRFQAARELIDALAEALEQNPPALVTAPVAPFAAEGHEGLGAEIEFGRPGEPAEPATAPISRRGADRGAPATGPISRPGVTSPATPAQAHAAVRVLNVPAAEGDAATTGQRPPAASLVDTGTSSSVKERPFDLPAPSTGRGRSSGWAIVTVVMAAVGVGAWQLWRTRNVADSPANLPANASAASPGVSSPSFDSRPPLPALPTTVPRWMTLVQSGQAQVSQGELPGAIKTFREALELGGNAQARAIADHAAAALGNKGPCRLTGLGRLRPLSMASGTVGRPLLIKTNRSLLAVWADDHEGPRHDHAYAIALDGALRPLGAPIDLTPEAEDVGTLTARAVGDRVALLYTETRGPRAGLFLRWLDGDGRIDAPAVAVASPRAAAASQPAIASENPETFWAVWDEERDGDSADLMARKFDAHGPGSSEARLTDFLGRLSGPRTRAALPGVAVTAGTLHVLFRLERETMRSVQHMALPDAERTLGPGVVSPLHGARADRTAAPLHAMALDRSEKTDTPSIACDALGCFAAWHIERPGGGGAYAAFLDPKTGQMIWRKRFATTGGRPSVAMGPPGVARLVWFEQGRVRTATLSREGIGPASSLARVSGVELPPASVVMGSDPGDWAISWLDVESPGHTEPYALRATCPTAPAGTPAAASPDAPVKGSAAPPPGPSPSVSSASPSTRPAPHAPDPRAP